MYTNIYIEIFVLQIYIFIYYIYIYNIHIFVSCKDFCQYLYIMRFKYFSILSFYHRYRSLKIQEIESASPATLARNFTLEFQSIHLNVQLRATWRIETVRKTENAKFALSIRHDARHIFVSFRIKIKAGHERTISMIEAFNRNEVQDTFALSCYLFAKMYNAWDFEKERSVSSLLFITLYPSSSIFPMMIIFRSSPLSIFSISIEIPKTCIVKKRLSNIVK